MILDLADSLVISQVIKDHFDRCQQHEAIGIPLVTLIEENRPMPPGWRLDYETMYALPPEYIEGDRRCLAS